MKRDGRDSDHNRFSSDDEIDLICTLLYNISLLPATSCYIFAEGSCWPCAASHTRRISISDSDSAILNSLVGTGPLFFDSRPNFMRYGPARSVQGLLGWQ